MALHSSSSELQMLLQSRRTNHHRGQGNHAVPLKPTTPPPHIIQTPRLVSLAALFCLLLISFPSTANCSFIFSTASKNRGNLSWSMADLGEDFLEQGVLQVLETAEAMASSEALSVDEQMPAMSAFEAASNVSSEGEELFEDAMEDLGVEAQQDPVEVRIPSPEQEIEEVAPTNGGQENEGNGVETKVQSSTESQRRDEEKVTDALFPLPLHRRLVLLGRKLLEFTTSIKNSWMKRPKMPVKLADELDSKVKKGFASGLAIRIKRRCCCCVEFVSEATRRGFHSYFIAPWLPDLRKNTTRALIRVIAVLGLAAAWESVWLMILEIPYDWLSMLQYENHIRLISVPNNPWRVKITFAVCLCIRAFIRLFVTGKWVAITTLAVWESRTSKVSRKKLVTTAFYTAALTFVPFFCIKVYELYQFLLKHWRQTERDNHDQEPDQ